MGHQSDLIWISIRWPRYDQNSKKWWKYSVFHKKGFLVCTPHVHHMYIHLMYTTCTPHKHHMYTTCTPHVHTPHVHHMYTTLIEKITDPFVKEPTKDNLSPSEFQVNNKDGFYFSNFLPICFVCLNVRISPLSVKLAIIQLISYKRYLECTLIQWRLSIYP